MDLQNIYTSGFFVAFALSIYFLREGKYCTLGDIIWSLVFALLSWVTVIALCLGQYLKRKNKNADVQ